MGIQGLLPLLKSIQKPTELGKLSGETLGVDAYGWLHRGAVGCAIELAQGKPTRKYVDFAMHRVRMVKHFGVTPYMVFDGDFLPSKARTEDSRAKRREHSQKAGLELLRAGKPSQAQLELQKAIDVTPEMARHLIEELKREGVPYVVAPYEADAQLVYLERCGLTNGSISEDSDLLVFGARRLLTKMDQHGRCIEINRSQFCAVREISLTGWSDEQFRQMAIFSGCDYLESIGNMGLKTSYRMMRKYKTPERVIRMLQFDGKFRVSENYLAQYKQAELTFLHQRVYCPEKQELVLLTEPDPSSQLDVEEMPFIGARVDPELARAIAIGDVNPITKERIIPVALPDKRRTNVSSATRAGLATSDQGGAAPEKPINSYFKDHRRIPMGEMDRNCFSVDPERVAALTQNGLTPRVFPLPRPYLDDVGVSSAPRPYTGSNISRRRTEPISRTLRDLDPTFDSSTIRRRSNAPARRISDAEARPPKKARLCEDDSTNETPYGQAERSRFFQPQNDAHLMSDDSTEEALASLPDIGDDWKGSRSSRTQPHLHIFQDEDPAVEPKILTDQESKSGDAGAQDSVQDPRAHRSTQDESNEMTSDIAGKASGKSLRKVLKKFSYTPNVPKTTNRTRMAFGLPTPASSVQAPQTRSHPSTPTESPLQTPLQRMRAVALQRNGAIVTPMAQVRKSSAPKRPSLAESLENFPINPSFVPLPKVDMDEVEALNKAGGSEDLIIHDSDEENEPPTDTLTVKANSSDRLRLSRFVFS
ncbi:Rad2 nuclease [Gnomoniopsis sp. IMI 355080]|nr:Rad2 nuclease [Gnomoniopsis sp. IMI 355080]